MLVDGMCSKIACHDVPLSSVFHTPPVA